MNTRGKINFIIKNNVLPSDVKIITKKNLNKKLRYTLH